MSPVLRFIPCITRNVVFLLGYLPTKLIAASFELLLHPEERPPSNIFSPITTMTAPTVQSGREKCLTSGMNDCVSKPVSPQKPTYRLEKWLTKIKDEGESIKNEREPGMTHEVESDDPPVWNRQKLMECLMDDEE